MSIPKILISDKLSPKGIEVLSGKFQVDVKLGLSEDELVKIIKDYDAMIVRSETTVTAKIIHAADNLKIIGRAGVGVDNINVLEATKKGIIVVNSPDGNTVAAAEHSFALLMSMARNIPFAYVSMQNKEWNRAAFTGIELQGKKIGVIGLGKIGRKVVQYAHGLDMEVLGYDPYINAEYAKQINVQLFGLDEVLKKSDFITFHIPKTKETQGLINKEKFALMKDGVFLVNCARGGIVVESDLRDAVLSGKVKGAAVDVFSEEPVKQDNPLVGIPGIITTPHLGASTKEAQVNVAVDVAEQIYEVLNGGQARGAVNIPSLKPEMIKPVQEFMALTDKMGSIMSQLIQGEAVSEIVVEYYGQIVKNNVSPLKLSLLKGLLGHLEQGVVNFVNAEMIASDRGIKIKEIKTDDSDDYKSLIVLKVKTNKLEHNIAGTYFEDIGEIIVQLNGLKVNFAPLGMFLVVPNDDKPGIIGSIGTILGKSSINIASMLVGREAKGGNAVMIVCVDQIVDPKVLNEIQKIKGIRGEVKLVSL